jgi:hypothetical protein
MTRRNPRSSPDAHGWLEIAAACSIRIKIACKGSEAISVGETICDFANAAAHIFHMQAFFRQRNRPFAGSLAW